MQLSWAKDQRGGWCAFDGRETPAIGDHGVFIVWRNGDVAHVSSVMYLGHGDLSYQIARCRHDSLFHGAPGLKITWAKVDDLHLIDGIASYLYKELRPMWGEVVPWAPPVAVNLPAA